MARDIIPSSGTSAQSKSSASAESFSNLTVEITECCIAWYGSRADLEDEGLIPAGTVWPEGGSKLHWSGKTARFELRRTARPFGDKTRGAWRTGDYFRLLQWSQAVQNAGSADGFGSFVQKAERQLQRARWEASPAGREQWRRVLNARYDTAFMAMLRPLLAPGGAAGTQAVGG